MADVKAVETVLSAPEMHWVGDGFPVASVISPQRVGRRLSPFVLMDYGGPHEFAPAKKPRGVDSHPHRGFETVTLVFAGELEHRDSAGNRGKIGPGDVQWMTAGAGVLHEEKHSAEFTRKGGAFEVAQLWVNLPKKDKTSPPGYQTLTRDAIPVVDLAGGAGRVRVIAGEFGGARGAAKTFTPIALWDVALNKGAEARLPMPEGWNAAVFVRHGSVWVGGTHSTDRGQLAVVSREGGAIALQAAEDSHVLVLGGEGIDEPVVAYGPFVLSSPEEIQVAIDDVRAGRFGKLD